MGSSDTSAKTATPSTSGAKLKDYGITYQDLQIENFDLIAKVRELLNQHQLWGPDGTYTFNDGERWARLETDDANTSD